MQKIRLLSFILISSSIFKKKLFVQIIGSTASPRENISSGFIAVDKNDNRSKEFKDIYVKMVKVDEQQSPPLSEPSGMPRMLSRVHNNPVRKPHTPIPPIHLR